MRIFLAIELELELELEQSHQVEIRYESGKESHQISRILNKTQTRCGRSVTVHAVGSGLGVAGAGPS